MWAHIEHMLFSSVLSTANTSLHFTITTSLWVLRMATLLFPGNQALERWSYSSKITQLLSGRLHQAWSQCYLLHSPWAKPPLQDWLFRTMATGVVRKDWDRDLRVWAHRRGWPQSLPGLRVEYEKRLKADLGRKDSEPFMLKMESKEHFSPYSLSQSSSLKKKCGFLSIPDDFRVCISNPRHCSL